MKAAANITDLDIALFADPFNYFDRDTTGIA